MFVQVVLRGRSKTVCFIDQSTDGLLNLQPIEFCHQQDLKVQLKLKLSQGVGDVFPKLTHHSKPPAHRHQDFQGKRHLSLLIDQRCAVLKTIWECCNVVWGGHRGEPVSLSHLTTPSDSALAECLAVMSVHSSPFRDILQAALGSLKGLFTAKSQNPS